MFSTGCDGNFTWDRDVRLLPRRVQGKSERNFLGQRKRVCVRVRCVHDVGIAREVPHVWLDGEVELVAQRARLDEKQVPCVLHTEVWKRAPVADRIVLEEYRLSISVSV